MLKKNKMSKGSLPKISPLVQIVYALMTPILLKIGLDRNVYDPGLRCIKPS